MIDKINIVFLEIYENKKHSESANLCRTYLNGNETI